MVRPRGEASASPGAEEQSDFRVTRWSYDYKQNEYSEHLEESMVILLTKRDFTEIECLKSALSKNLLITNKKY